MTRGAEDAVHGSGEQAGAGRDNATDTERTSARPGPDGARRDAANWAWACRSSAGYDWMDHAPLFRHDG